MALKVLYIEDNPFNMRLVGKMLKMSGYSMTGAPTGLAGIETYEAEQPDLILLDMNLPDIDGLEVLARLQEDTSFSTPVVALTANAMYGDRERFLESGCVAYISKPVDRRELVEVLVQLFGEVQPVND